MQHLLNVTGIMTPIISSCRNTLKSGGAVGAPLFSPNALKRPLNWPKFTHKFLEARPNVPGYPLSSDRGSATVLWGLHIISFYFP